MRIICCFLLALFGLGVTGVQARVEGELAPGLVNPGAHEHPPWFKQSFLDMREDVAEASAQGKRVMLYFYQDGCPYCAKLLRDNFAQSRIADATRRYFDVIAINLWGDREVTDFDGQHTTEKRFARALKVMFTPTVLLLDTDGKVALRINGYFPPHRFLAAISYVGEGLDAKESFREYLARTLPEPASGRLHTVPGALKAPYQLQAALKADSRPLMVLFEQQECRDCDELHEVVFRRAETQHLLKDFQIVVLDMWAPTPLTTPAGKASTAADWANALGIDYAPSMVFFDRAGQRVFSTGGYLRAFHVQSVLDYVASGAYRTQPEFQRYIESRADALRARGIKVDIWR
ncbi:thioredoxin [Acidihalobacter yilgarnensis]|uniref:Thioredoxin n=1 Tax=Acidihalobacter yilgarnensis TaxID=2819280 RepID=A0A1D8IMI1_9GAMM|nr:thioredoxin fold domain-containing protein [Acidihalobacter yilgarnensis]AOU97621.1 thioredoxin [Acidihalobacter yilgarnensis]